MYNPHKYLTKMNEKQSCASAYTALVSTVLLRDIHSTVHVHPPKGHGYGKTGCSSAVYAYLHFVSIPWFNNNFLHACWYQDKILHGFTSLDLSKCANQSGPRAILVWDRIWVTTHSISTNGRLGQELCVKSCRSAINFSLCIPTNRVIVTLLSSRKNWCHNFSI